MKRLIQLFAALHFHEAFWQFSVLKCGSVLFTLRIESVLPNAVLLFRIAFGCFHLRGDNQTINTATSCVEKLQHFSPTMIVSVIVEASAVSGKCRRHSMPAFEICLCGKAHRSKEQRMPNAKWNTKKNRLPQNTYGCLIEQPNEPRLGCRLRSSTNNWQPEQINAPKISAPAAVRLVENRERYLSRLFTHPCNDTNLKSSRR